MLDLGVYCVNAVRNLFQEEPVLAFASAEMKDGTDDTTSALLRFASGRIAHFTVSNSIAGLSSYRSWAPRAICRVEPAFEYTDKIEHHLTLEGKSHSTKFGKRDQFAPELEYFSRCILEGLTPEPDARRGHRRPASDRSLAEVCTDSRAGAPDTDSACSPAFDGPRSEQARGRQRGDDPRALTEREVTAVNDLLRFTLGAAAVSFFSALTEVFKPKTFPGILAAAPAVALFLSG